MPFYYAFETTTSNYNVRIVGCLNSLSYFTLILYSHRRKVIVLHVRGEVKIGKINHGGTDRFIELH